MKTNPNYARANKHIRRAPEHNPSRIVVPAADEGVLQDILSAQPSALYLVLDCVQDPHNLGAILRTANGAGVAAVVAPKDRSVGITETVLRVSVGAAEQIPFIRVTNLARTLRAMRQSGIRLIGTSDKGTRPLYDTDLRGPLAIVMGAEGEGMRRLTEETCDCLVNIPMAGSVPCLNVSVATGVCLFEAVRQRRPAADTQS